MSTDLVLVPPQPNAVGFPTPEEDFTGLGDVRSKPGNIVLIQPTTRESYGGRPGQFIDTFDNSIHDAIDVVGLRHSVGRVYFPEGGDLNAEPLCRSNDGKVPSPFIMHPMASKCGDWANGRFVATCPKAMWIGGKPSACRDTRRLVVAMKETGMPAFLNVRSTSIKPYEMALNSIKKDIALNFQKNGLKLFLYDYTFTIKSQKAPPNSKGVFYILSFESIKRVPEPGQYFSLYNQTVVQYKSLLEEEQQSAVAEIAADNAVGKVVDAEFVEPEGGYQAA